jgi:hypothetical protein
MQRDQSNRSSEKPAWTKMGRLLPDVLERADPAFALFSDRKYWPEIPIWQRG